MGAILTDSPTRAKMMTPVARCSLCTHTYMQFKFYYTIYLNLSVTLHFKVTSIYFRSSPDTQKLGTFARCRGLRLDGETAHMVDGKYCGGDEPGRAEERAGGLLDGDDQHIQVVAAPFLLTHPHHRK